jgi:exodeoxyribonuclease VII large subunit
MAILPVAIPDCQFHNGKFFPHAKEGFLSPKAGHNTVPRDRPVQHGIFDFDGKQGGPGPLPGPSQRQDQKVYTVSEVTRIIKERLVTEPDLQRMLITGEVFEVSIPSSGHIYFSLKDAEAVIKCVMWRSRTEGLTFKLEPGMKVVAYGSIGVYERSGNYQVYVDRLQPEGLGALYLAFERLRKKLEAEGLFDEARKRPIPKFPTVVGLVTSPTGAAIQDIIRVSTSRWPAARILLAPASVQGGTAAQEIIQAIGLLNEAAEQEGIDVIIVARGGGSPEDLAAFNDEALARAIIASKIPIVTGIGHEVDRTIADYVADRYAATPSQAAELVFPDAREQRAHVQDLISGIASRTKAIIVRRRERLDLLMARRALARPKELVDLHRQALDDITSSLTEAIKHRIEASRHALALASRALASLDPTAILGRGYSITLDGQGQVVKDPEQVNVGEGIKVIVHRGEVDARVEARRRKAEGEHKGTGDRS